MSDERAEEAGWLEHEEQSRTMIAGEVKAAVIRHDPLTSLRCATGPGLLCGCVVGGGLSRDPGLMDFVMTPRFCGSDGYCARRSLDGQFPRVM